MSRILDKEGNPKGGEPVAKAVVGVAPKPQPKVEPKPEPKEEPKTEVKPKTKPKTPKKETEEL